MTSKRALRRGTALTRSEKKEQGPVQIVVLGFEDVKFEAEIIPKLQRLHDAEIVRLVDMVIVTKSQSGELVPVKASELTEDESAQFGKIAGALVGLGTDEDADAGEAEPAELHGYVGDDRTWSVIDVIPTGTMALVALLEHRWAIPMRDALRNAGGSTLADAWVHPDDLALAPAKHGLKR